MNSLSFFLCGAGDQTQVLAYARQALYHRSESPDLPLFVTQTGLKILLLLCWDYRSILPCLVPHLLLRQKILIKLLTMNTT
jgi:hypothetical protein